MGSELETRRNDRGYLFQILKSQHNSATPNDFEELLAWTKAQMESDDVKMVLQGFEEWKKKNV
ncbi:MAG: hypothetical protein LBS19_05640 [Clostridiales bacterium]|jgi:hypothetical protein|nr:hypothetical protein [Clostridiales bacterium]